MAKGQSSDGFLVIVASEVVAQKNIKQSFLLAAIAVVVGAISFHMQTPNTYMHAYIHTHLYVNPSHKTRYYSCFVFYSFFIRSYVLFYL